MEPDRLRESRVTKTDLELAEWVEDWVGEAARTGARNWSISIPVNFHDDPDVLICELAARFRERAGIARQAKKVI